MILNVWCDYVNPTAFGEHFIYTLYHVLLVKMMMKAAGTVNNTQISKSTGTIINLTTCIIHSQANGPWERGKIQDGDLQGYEKCIFEEMATCQTINMILNWIRHLLIKNTIKTVILWLQFKITVFHFLYDGKAKFLAAITSVLRLTQSFKSHAANLCSKIFFIISAENR